MPFFGLYAKMELENVQKFSVPDDTSWTIDVKQAAGDDMRKDVQFDPADEEEVPNNKGGKATFLVKFEGDKQVSTLRVCPAGELKKYPTQAQTADDTAMVLLLACECRGLEPVGWTPVGPYAAELDNGKTFEVDFRESNEWCDYDDKSDTSVMVSYDPEKPSSFFEWRRIVP